MLAHERDSKRTNHYIWSWAELISKITKSDNQHPPTERIHYQTITLFEFFFRTSTSQGRLSTLHPAVGLRRAISSLYSRTPSKLAIQWLISGENVVPIPGTMNSKQGAENVVALTVSLTPAAIEDLNKGTWPGEHKG